jgi:hydrogenase assembly chaperone HypC/HupF
MCLAYPGTVLEINNHHAIVGYSTGENKNVLCGESLVKVGDKVLVQIGIIVKVLSEQENQQILEAWKSLDDKLN